jgi:hypothetical protein
MRRPVLIAFVAALVAVAGLTAIVSHAARERAHVAAAPTPSGLAVLTPEPTRTPTGVDLRALLAPTPAGAQQRADRTFTLADIPADAVWQGLAGRGFTRGAVRQWTTAGGGQVTIVLFQFESGEKAASFAQRIQVELAYWPNCANPVDAGAPWHAHYLTCPPLTKVDTPAERGIVYRFELVAYLVITGPPAPDLFGQQGALL